MTDAQFIIGLMRTETDALGFIPSTAIRARFLPQGLIIFQRDRRNRRIGYLIHGPPRPGARLYVHQCVIQYDHRRRYYASETVRELIRRATAAHCREIALRCALDLEANAFWRASGFQLIAITPGGKRRHREICHYLYPLCPHPRPETPPGLISTTRPLTTPPTT